MLWFHKHFLKHKFLVLAFFFFLLVLGVFIYWQGNRLNNFSSVPDHGLVNWRLNNEALVVEVVKSSTSITQGLSGRDDVQGDGMLFVLSKPQRAVFWMKDMKFALDLVWLRNGQIVGITKNVQPPNPGTPENELRLYPSPQEVDMVLETHPGRLSKD